MGPDLIATALARLDASPSGWVMGPYRAQAEIARAHIVATSPEQTDWPRILRIYRVLSRGGRLTRDRPQRGAVALAMVEGPARGLAAIDEIGASGELDDYALYHSSLRRPAAAGAGGPTTPRSPTAAPSPWSAPPPNAASSNAAWPRSAH